MDPQQELFTTLKVKLDELPYTVYDGIMPPDGVPYPFIYLGENQEVDTPLKGGCVGTIIQTIHVYSNDVRRRGTMSGIILGIKRICALVGRTGHYNFDLNEVSSQILPDNTTAEPLLHGVIEARYKY